MDTVEQAAIKADHSSLIQTLTASQATLAKVQGELTTKVKDLEDDKAALTADKAALTTRVQVLEDADVCPPHAHTHHTPHTRARDEVMRYSTVPHH